MVTLIPVSGTSDRFFIRLCGQHAGGITIHSIQGDCFSYGIAIAPAFRRKGVARHALKLLFAQLHRQGMRRVCVQVAPSNAASLALHHALGFAETERSQSTVTLCKTL